MSIPRYHPFSHYNHAHFEQVSLLCFGNGYWYAPVQLYWSPFKLKLKGEFMHWSIAGFQLPGSL
jgi:hypothetical protein